MFVGGEERGGQVLKQDHRALQSHLPTQMDQNRLDIQLKRLCSKNGY